MTHTFLNIHKENIYIMKTWDLKKMWESLPRTFGSWISHDHTFSDVSKFAKIISKVICRAGGGGRRERMKEDENGRQGGKERRNQKEWSISATQRRVFLKE